jgi:hypothetical protein
MAEITAFLTLLRRRILRAWRSFRVAPEHSWGTVLILLSLILAIVLILDAYVFWWYAKGINQLSTDPTVEIVKLRENHFNSVIETLNTKQRQYERARVQQNIQNIFR